MNGKLVLAGLLLVGGTIVALAGASPQAALSPTQAVEQGPGGDHVAVKGAVASVDRANRTFALVDGTSNLTVTLDHALPARISPGLGLVATGELVDDGGTLRLQADEVQLGCPSKYEGA